jgi:iron-sulfur cluster assembly protein
MVEITAAAAEQIKVGLANLDDGDMMLRLAVRQLDSGDLDYAIGFDEAREQDERLTTASGITVLVSPPSLPAAAGTVIDFVEIEPGDMRFIFYRSGDVGGDPPSAAASGGG